MPQTATPPTQQPAVDQPSMLLFPDYAMELATTRRILERVPDGKNDWKPHEKSMTLDALATHVAQLPGFGVLMLTGDEFDISGGLPPAAGGDTATRLKTFDDVAAQLTSLLKKMTWEQARSNWKFRAGDRVIVDAPRGTLIRSMVLTHIAHHRAQLGVYLRLLGVPVPSTYGPTADEPFPTS